MKKLVFIAFSIFCLFTNLNALPDFGVSFNYSNATELNSAKINHSRIGGTVSLYTDSLLGWFDGGYYFKAGFLQDLTNNGGVLKDTFKGYSTLDYDDITINTKNGTMSTVPLRFGIWHNNTINSKTKLTIAWGGRFDITFGKMQVEVQEENEDYDLENNVYNGDYFLVDILSPFIDLTMHHNITSNTSLMYGLDISLGVLNDGSFSGISTNNKTLNENFVVSSFEVSPYIGLSFKLGEKSKNLAEPIFSHNSGLYSQGDMTISIRSTVEDTNIAYKAYSGYYSPDYIIYDKPFDIKLAHEPITIEARLSKKNYSPSFSEITLVPNLTDEQIKNTRTVISEKKGNTVSEDYIITIQEDYLPHCDTKTKYTIDGSDPFTRGIIYQDTFSLSVTDNPVLVKATTTYSREGFLLLTTRAEKMYYPISDEEKESRKKIIVTNVSSSTPNSAGGVNLYVNFINTSEKIIKYVTFSAVPYNRVNDIVSSDITGRSAFRGIFTGPYQPGQESDRGYFENAWYNYSIEYVKLTGIEIEYMDGSFEFINGEELEAVQNN